MTRASEVVRILGKASVFKVFGFSSVPIAVVGIFLVPLWRDTAQGRIIPANVVAPLILIGLFLWLLGYILLVGGRTITVSANGLELESWASQLLGVGRTIRLRWKDIQAVSHKSVSNPHPEFGGSIFMVVLETVRGRFVFREPFFPHKELRWLERFVATRGRMESSPP